MKADPTNAKTMMEEILMMRSLLVLGAGLGVGAVKLPDRYYSSYVVLILRPNGHYGFRKKRYTEGGVSTWEGETDALPCDCFWDICLVLQSIGMQTRMRCL